jgi:hypothetical protein
MTPEERNLLTNFLQDLDQARGGPKDPDAQSMIAQALARNPDAAYLLVQHTILSDQALHAAQARIAELESQAAQGPAPQGGFLGGGQQQGPWGSAPPQPEPQPRYYDPQYAPQSPQYAPQQPQYAQPQYAQPQYAQPQYAPPPASPFSNGGGLGSFLRTAGTTAAGVAGGAMLFEGLSGMFGGHHGFGGGGFGGGYGGGFGGGPAVENVTVNEYNDDDRSDDRDDDRDDDDRNSDWDDSN